MSIRQHIEDAATAGMEPVTTEIRTGFYEISFKEWQNNKVVRERWLPIKIWYGPPHDPDTGEEMDRSWRWQCLLDGKEADWYDIWPPTAAVSETKYEMMLAGNPGEIVTRVDFFAIQRKSSKLKMEN